MIIVIQLLVLLATIAVFGLTLKVYTEMLKDQAQNRRSKQ